MTEFHLIGPPGTGKTTALATAWIPRAATKFGPDRVVVCSLTKAAAAEVAGRDSGIPRDQVGTLHALCYRALGRPKVAEGEVADWNARHPGWAVESSGLAAVDEPDHDARGLSRGSRIASRCQVLRHRMVKRELWPEDCRNFQAAWDKWCLERDLTDFTGLLERALQEVPACPGRPAVLIVDEAQDMSLLEATLVRSWSASCAYSVFAGDPDQAIYGWRGSDPDAVFGRVIPPENRYSLKQSYRLPREVHAQARKWILASRERSLDTPFAPRDADGSVVRLGGAPEELARWALEGEGTSMVLATCGYMLNPLIAHLRKSGTPFHNPWRRKNGAWNPLRGGGDRLSALLAPDRDTFGDAARLWSWRDVWRWAEPLRSEGTLARGAKEKLRDLVQSDEDERHGRGEERPDPTDAELAALLEPEAWRQLQAATGIGLVEWHAARVLATWRDKMSFAYAVARKRGTRALITTPRVVVGTCHSTKGGEAARVALMADLSSAGMEEWTGRPRDHDAVRRTLYVGMTRARDSLALCQPSSWCAVQW